MVWIFPCKRWGSDGPTGMPLVSFLLLRPPTVKSKMFQDLFESWFLVFFYSFSLYFLLGILLNSISQFLGIVALYKLTVSNIRFSVSPLSAVNLFTISIFSNTGWIEVNPSPWQTCLGGTCEGGRSTCCLLASACCHLAFGGQLLHPHLHSQALWGSITWFINVCECLECFPTGGLWVKYMWWHLLKQRKEPRKREDWGRKGKHLGVGMRMCQVEGSWPTLRQRTNCWVIVKAVNLM